MNQFQTVFSQFVSLVPRHTFNKCVGRFNGDFRVKKFKCWSQFTVMLFAQLVGRISLRDIAISFSNKKRYFYHLGIKTVKRSTLADANELRDHRIYQDLFHEILLRCRDIGPKHKFRFKNKLSSFDATMISLCLKVFPWAKFRQSKGGIKLHTKLDHSGHLPSFVVITDAKTPEIQVARTLQLEAGSISVFDRAMVGFSWLNTIDNRDACWVTKMKKGIKFETVIFPKKKLPPLSRRSRKNGVLSDRVIRLTGTKKSALPKEIRLIVFQDPDTGEIHEFITNIFHLSALTIAEIYKARWEIEIFFKWIKQHLKIKTFIGTSENAVKTQIWIAMITYLLLSYLKYKTKCQYSLLEIQRHIRDSIFDRVYLEHLISGKLNQDIKKPKLIPKQNQLCLLI